jgi:hypothetical protein
MSRRSLAFAVIAFVLVSAAAACGGDGGRDAAEANRQTRAEGGATRDEFVAKARAICTAGDESLPGDVSDAPTEERLMAAMDVWSSVVSQLRVLKPPAGDEARVDRMLTHFEHAIRAGRGAATVNDETALAAFAGLVDQGSRAAVIAESYGLDVCSPIPALPPAEEIAENKAYQEAMLDLIRQLEQDGQSLKVQP